MESAWSSTCVSARERDDTARVSTGVSAGLLRLYVGGDGSVRGSSEEAALSAAWTSCSAAPMGRSRLNCRVICEVPKLLREVICASPAMAPSWRSRAVVTDDAMVSALAPGSVVDTTRVG